MTFATRIHLSLVSALFLIFVFYFFIFEKGVWIYSDGATAVTEDLGEFMKGDAKFEIDGKFNKQTSISKTLRPHYNLLVLSLFGPQGRRYIEGINGWYFLTASLYQPRNGRPLPFRSSYVDLLSDFKNFLEIQYSSELSYFFAPNKILIYPEHLPGSERYVEYLVSEFGEFAMQLRARGITYFDLTEDFRKHKNEGDVELFFDADPHWNPGGASLVTEVLVDFLKKKNIPRRNSFAIKVKHKSYFARGAVHAYMDLPRSFKGLSDYNTKYRIKTSPEEARPDLLMIGDSLIVVPGLEAMIARKTGLYPHAVASSGLDIGGKIHYFLTRVLSGEKIPHSVPSIFLIGIAQLRYEYSHGFLKKQISLVPKVLSASEHRELDLSKAELVDLELREDSADVLTWVPDGDEPRLSFVAADLSDGQGAYDYLVYEIKDREIRARRNGFIVEYEINGKRIEEEYSFSIVNGFQKTIVPLKLEGQLPTRITFSSKFRPSTFTLGKFRLAR